MKPPIVLLIFAVVLAGFSISLVQEASAAGPVIATGAQRDAIKSQHILDRPQRPLHFYGNTVRRRHSRGK